MNTEAAVYCTSHMAHLLVCPYVTTEYYNAACFVLVIWIPAQLGHIFTGMIPTHPVALPIYSDNPANKTQLRANIVSYTGNHDNYHTTLKPVATTITNATTTSFFLPAFLCKLLTRRARSPPQRGILGLWEQNV